MYVCINMIKHDDTIYIYIVYEQFQMISDVMQMKVRSRRNWKSTPRCC